MTKDEFKKHVDNIEAGLFQLYDQRHEYYYSAPSTEEEAKYQKENGMILDAGENSLRALKTWTTQGLAFGGEGGDV